MVLDISRWIDEHPGGSNIIPDQALNIDSTVFFEIYHASKQSFLYLKEFYIGELYEEDKLLLPIPEKGGVQGSAAFLEQLTKLTTWRLNSKELAILYKNQKSF
jgi:cytochrome b involved in lipid metabolism